MAWYINGQNLQMCEGDFGIQLPVTVSGTTLSAGDTLRFTFKNAVNGQTLLTKIFDTFSQNTVNLEFTEAESALFPIGSYVYNLDWYQDGNFMCNIITVASLKVVDKA